MKANAQVDSLPLVKRVEMVHSPYSISEQIEGLGINPKKYKLNQVCDIVGQTTDCKPGRKRLSNMLRFFDQSNKEVLAGANGYGPWTYMIQEVDENKIIILGDKAVSMVVQRTYEFTRR